MIQEAIGARWRERLVRSGRAAAFDTGVVRAPLTAVVIVSEMTADRAMLLPLFAAAITADAVAKAISPERLYHGLSHAFAQPAAAG